MAQESPSSADVQDIQFKLHDRFNVFPAVGPLRNNVNLLAVASNQGMLFAGNPYAAEFKVILLKDLVEAKTKEVKLCARQIQLPGLPNVLATSADGSMIAVNFSLNGIGFLNVYSVPSFLTPNVVLLYNLRLSVEENVSALQILWNPVLTSNVAIVLSNGALVMYTLMNEGNFDLHSLDKKHQVRCGCWSPKGKQIVLGFPNGRLQQFKPDLTPAKTIACPDGVHPTPFDTIAVHWLSTFQFIVAFLQHGEEQSPTLYIVNAPKNAPVSYINYFDICYSATGPRQHQINFTHIQAWNLLIVTSANGVELGVLGTKGNGELPTWVQFALLDEARIEMPLTENKDETYPIGFAFDTSSTHQVVIGEKKLPVMPMVHVLSTHGHLVSFNFLNLAPNGTDICSPPPPISDKSGLFKSLDELNDVVDAISTSSPPEPTETSFTFSLPTKNTISTPAPKEKPKLMFGINGGNNVGTINSTVTTQSGQSSSLPFAAPKSTSVLTSALGPTINSTTNNTNSGGHSSGGMREQPNAIQTSEAVKQPLYTIPATYTPPVNPIDQQNTAQQHKAFIKPQTNSNEIDEIVKQMIAVQVNAFNFEIQQIKQHSNSLLMNIGKPDEIKSYTKLLNNLQEIVDQANDRDFETDVQQLRHSLNECYTMVAECRTKLEMYKNPDLTRLTSMSTFDPVNRRQLVKLQAYVTANQAQLQQLQQQIDAQWANYQDLVRRNSRNRIHIPCLDGIYQRMTKLKDSVANQRNKINYIKTKLKEKGLIFKSLNDLDTKVFDRSETTVESLADSVLSMSLIHGVDATRSKLSDEKLNTIRNVLRDRPIVRIQPHRPDRVGLKSEVILETKLKVQAQSREGASICFDKMQPQKGLYSASSTMVSKPVASKPTSVQGSCAPTFSSSGAAFPTFGAMTHNPSLTYGQSKIVTNKAGASSEPTNAASTINQQHVPISFAAKIVNSDGVTKSTKSTVSGQEKDTPATFGETTLPKVFSFGGDGKNGVATTFGVGNGRGDGKPPSHLGSVNAGNISIFSGFGSKKTSPFEIKSDNCFNASTTGSNTSNITTSTVATTATTLASARKPFAFGGWMDSKASVATIADTTKPTFNVVTASTSTSSKTPLFSGLGKSVGSDAITASITPSSSVTEKSATKTPIPSGLPTTATNPTVTTGNSTATTTTVATTTTTTTTTDTADSLLSSLNICKPTIREPVSTDNNKTANIFGSASLSIGASGEVSKSIFGGTSAGSIFSFGSKSTLPTIVATTSTAVASISPLPTEVKTSVAATAAAAAASSETNSTLVTSGSVASSVTSSASSTTFSFSLAGLDSGITESKVTTQSAPPSNSAPSTITSTTNASTFGKVIATDNKSIPSKTTSNDGNTVTTDTPSTTVSSPFGGMASMLSISTTVTTATSGTIAASAPSIFGTTTTTSPKASTPSIFGLPTTTSATTAEAAATTKTATGSVFASTASPTASSGNIFGGIPKPDQSVFGPPSTAPPTPAGGGLFAAAAAANPSPFASPSAASGGSIFGGTAKSGFGTNAAVSGGSIFGGGSTSPSSPFGTGASIFGGSPKQTEGSNMFGSPAQTTTSSAGGGSIFGQSTFGQSSTAQSGSSLFGSSGAQQSGTGFGGSIFGSGGANNTAASGASIFGGSSFGQNATGFGSFSQPSAGGAFGSPNSGGSFAHGGASVAQSGFGSPQQQTSPFSKPMFGCAPTFGSPPAFGAQPSFGGAPTFGSPKGFGNAFAATAGAATAAAPAPASSFTSPTQKNNLFEALGSSETGLSFGNLAQTSANAPKPAFGGSSFMNYRS